MKTAYIAIFSGATIAVMLFLFFVGLYSYEQSKEPKSGPVGAVSPWPLEFEKIETEPKTVTIGNTFQIYATIKNPNIWPITYHDSCVSPLTISFDKNVQIQHQIGCMAISTETINAGEQVRVHGPSTGIAYNATTIGTTNATITFSYQNQGIDQNITVSKQIEIEPPLPTPAQTVEQLKLGRMYVDPADPTKGIILDCKKPIGLQMKTIDESIDVQKAINLAYAYPDFISKVNQYGTVTYNSFFNDWVTGDPCNTIWKGVEMVFTATFDNGTARNIQVSEDIDLSKVLNVTEYQAGFSRG
ncbi:MAG: hypothetical protein ABI340_07970 [Nitrososphaera sp.]|jgi:hypothetical protein